MKLTRKFILILSFLVSVYFTGCAINQPLNTPSGRPEVIIENVSRKYIIDVLTNWMVNNGYEVKSINDYNAVYGKRSEDLTSSILLGSRYDSIPEYRISFAVMEYGNGVRIVQTLQAVTNPGSPYERITDFSHSEGARQWQTGLEQTKINLEKSSKKGRIGIDCDKEFIITKIYDNTPASQNGLKTGDKIIEVNGKKLPNTLSDEELKKFNNHELEFDITGEAGTIVELKILREGKENIFKIKRQAMKLG